MYEMGKQNYYPICIVQTKNKKSLNTTDQIIRVALRDELQKLHKDDPVKIIEELGINHGSARADLAAVNGTMHCYEIKSDRDTLLRLPAQIKAYNSVFDRVTIVVGLSHIFEAMEVIPNWWGIIVAKFDKDGAIVFSQIREAQLNQGRDSESIARLLWRKEALRILEEMDQAYGFRSKPRNVIYEKLAQSVELNDLANRVKEILCVRQAWRVPAQQV
jgi:hypothetical protein